LKVVDGKYPTSKLHFANTKEDIPDPEPIDIHPKDVRMLDVVFSQPRKSLAEYPPQDKPIFTSSYKGMSGGAIPIRLGDQADQLPGTRTFGRGFVPTNTSNGIEDSAMKARNEGCYIAANDALRNPLKYRQYFMPPREYMVEIIISADYFQSVRQRLRIFSTKNPLDLRVEALPDMTI
jgi:hypothetical protein